MGARGAVFPGRATRPRAGEEWGQSRRETPLPAAASLRQRQLCAPQGQGRPLRQARDTGRANGGWKRKGGIPESQPGARAPCAREQQRCPGQCPARRSRRGGQRRALVSPPGTKPQNLSGERGGSLSPGSSRASAPACGERVFWKVPQHGAHAATGRLAVQETGGRVNQTEPPAGEQRTRGLGFHVFAHFLNFLFLNNLKLFKIIKYC